MPIMNNFHGSRPLPALALLMAGALASWTDSALAETTLSFYLGASHTRNSDIRIRQPGTGSDATFHGVSWNSESFRNPLYYGLRISHFLEKRPEWGMGLDYTHDKVFAQTSQAVQVDGVWSGAPVNETAPMNQRVQAFNISHGVNTLALNVYYRWARREGGPFFCRRCQPYVGAGPAYYLLHAENTVNGQNNSEGYQDAGWGCQLLAGLQYEITPAIGLFIEAKHNSGTVEVATAGGGSGKTTLNSTQLLGGLSMAF
jgi:outer membrane protein W